MNATVHHIAQPLTGVVGTEYVFITAKFLNGEGKFSLVVSNGIKGIKLHSECAVEFRCKIKALLSAILNLRASINKVGTYESNYLLTEVVRLTSNAEYSTANISYIIDHSLKRVRITVSDCTRNTSMVFNDLNGGDYRKDSTNWCDNMVKALREYLSLGLESGGTNGVC